ncbi:MAG TPA: DMT family transporter [Actinomycetota bacterium]|jgi:drug/metabolite transporter (DMT)-like permease|nr:DMT family transporter [Actinomycetota bacterium]
MPARRLGLLALGVVAVSFSAIFIRWAAAPALAVAFYRNAMAAAVLLPIALARHREEFRRLSRRDWAIALSAGGLLALHFGLWIPSLSYTTVAASTVLVTSQPVWVAVMGRGMGESASGATLGGIALSMLGVAIISGGDLGLSGRAGLGDLLALLAAVAAAGYFLSGRTLRARLSLLTYVGIVYTTCSVLLAATMAVAGTPFSGFSLRVWGLFALMALVPQFLGHTVFNYLLAHLRATVVAVAVTGEPVGATLLAFVILGEVPRWTAFAGGAVILAGIYVTLSAQTRRPAPVPIE